MNLNVLFCPPRQILGLSLTSKSTFSPSGIFGGMRLGMINGLEVETTELFTYSSSVLDECVSVHVEKCRRRPDTLVGLRIVSKVLWPKRIYCSEKA